MKLKQLRLGLLINCGLHKAYPERIIFDERRKQDFEQWDDGCLTDAFVKNLVEKIVAAIHRIDKTLGAAYHGDVYQAAMAVELKRNQLTYDDNVCIDAKIANIQFSPFEIDYWLIEKALLLGVLAGKDKPRKYDLIRMRSYLNRLQLHYGLIAFWSTKNLQLFGIYEP